MAIVRAISLVVAVAMFPAIANANSSGHQTVPQPAQHRAITVPEPTDLILFACGVVGLIIGRHTSRSRRRHDD